MKAGDRFTYTNGVRCTALRDSEDHVDITGLPVLKVWVRREDTGREGWVVYGPSAHFLAEVNK